MKDPRHSIHQYKNRYGESKSTHKLLELMMNALPSAIASFNSEGKLIIANSLWTEITGYSAGESIGQTFTNLLAAKDRLRAQTALMESLAKGCELSGYETKLVRKDREEKTVTLRVTPTFLEG